MCACMHACVHASRDACVPVWVGMRGCLCVHVSMCVCVSVCVYLCVPVCMCLCVRMYVCIYIYI